MKNKFCYLITFLMLVILSSCKDDVITMSEYGSLDREFMTMFRKDDNTGKGDNDPYKCQVVNSNDVHLYWYGVKGCAGYELKWALLPAVSSGLASDWENPANIIGDTIVGPDCLDIIIKDLQYSTDYRFAIRTLSAKGEEYNSNWYGYGSTNEWADYMQLTTDIRYNVPEVITVEDITKTTFRVKIDRALANAGGDESFLKNFEIDANGNFVMQKLKVQASPTNPSAALPDKWKDYTITDTDFTNGYIDVDGLTQNSVYVVDVENENIPVHWDAIYNTCVIRTDGDPGEPILIQHYCDPNDTIPGATALNACRIDTILNNFVADDGLSEGTIYELEGGKTYYLASSVNLCKGLTLKTRDEDLAMGKRAKVLLNGMSQVDGSPQTAHFYLGRRPLSGELGGINIKDLIFEGIDFDCPGAFNYGVLTSATGNYFMNMYSDGMAITVSSIQLKNCTFQRMIRGFVRVQGANRKVFEEFLVEDCLFYNCGYYNTKGQGYGWIDGDGKHAKSNIYKNMIFRRNTFYDSPREQLFTDSGADLNWGSDIQYNITFENNTVVNFSTRTSGYEMFDLKYMPGGSKITIKNNLFVLAKQEDDSRTMYFAGMYINTIKGSGIMTFDIENNYSTIGNYTGTEIFNTGAFSSTSNSAGRWPDYCINGTEQLVVKTGTVGISAVELMENPNPPYKNGDPLMHNVDNLFGNSPSQGSEYSGIGSIFPYGNAKSVNLYFQNTERVKNHEIYKNNIGDPRWRAKVY